MEVDRSGSIYNYVVTAYKSSAVLFSALGHFTSSADLNLALAKSSHIEIYKLTPDGLMTILDSPIYGHISAMFCMRLKGASKDQLFVLTSKYNCMVLEYDQTAGRLITKHSGEVGEKVGRPVDNGMLAIVDPDMRAIALHLYCSSLKILPIEPNGTLGQGWCCPFQPLQVIDIVFLTKCSKPTIAVLYIGDKESRNLAIYEIKLKDKELSNEALWTEKNLDPGAGYLIPVPEPRGGVLVMGENSIVYLNNPPTNSKSVPVSCIMEVKACGKVDPDGSRYMLGDTAGGLHLLSLEHDGNKVLGLKLTKIGNTNLASTVTYLDNRVVHIGSRKGDSQLVRIHEDAVDPVGDPDNYVEVLNTFTNIGPILDMVVMDLDRQGQGQVVTASGAGICGALRIIRSGIGLTEQATLEAPSMKGVWSLKRAPGDEFDTYLFLSMVNSTRVIGMTGEENMEEVRMAGLDADAQTLYAGNTDDGHLVQVTAVNVRLIAHDTLKLAHSWDVPAGERITMASGNGAQILLATASRAVVLLSTSSSGISVTASTTLNSDISCLYLPPSTFGAAAGLPPIAAVGTWNHELLLLLPAAGMLLACSSLISSEVISRSVLLLELEDVPMLLLGMGDGALMSWQLRNDPDKRVVMYGDDRRIILGTKPILLRAFKREGKWHAFAASDRPTVIHSSNKKLLYSSVNEGEVNYVAPFHTSSFPESLAMANESELAIRSMEDFQQHVRTVPLGEQPRRLAHQPATRTLAVTTQPPDPRSYTIARSHVRVMDDTTFDELASFKLDIFEMPIALTSCTLANDPTPYYVVATVILKLEEPNPTKSRVIVLAYKDKAVVKVAEAEVKGPVWRVRGFQGKLLVLAENRVELYNWVTTPGGAKKLEKECDQYGLVHSCYLDTRGDFILVGDLVKSILVVRYLGNDRAIEVRAKDIGMACCTAVAVLDDDTFLLADDALNLLVFRMNSDEAAEEERTRLERVGEFHLGELVNVFQRGSLVMQLPDSELSHLSTLIFGTVQGALKLLISLPKDLYDWLEKLQNAMRSKVLTAGNLDHAKWRAFQTPWQYGPSNNFIDGDLIEAFLDLKPEEVAEIAASMGPGISAQEITRKVEDLARLHK